MRGGGVFKRDVLLSDLRFCETDFRGLAEFDHVCFVAGESKPAVFKHDFAARAGDFESVRAGRLAGGGNEHAGRALRIFEAGGYVVLDLNVVIATELAETADA